MNTHTLPISERENLMKDFISTSRKKKLNMLLMNAVS